MAYFLVGILMFITIVGASYGRPVIDSVIILDEDLMLSLSVFPPFGFSGKLCWKLSYYFLWPFGKAIHQVHFDA